jgi:hypothetical protein
MVVRLFLIIFSFCPFAVSGQNQNENKCLPGEDHLTLTNDGAWCWFSDPRAILFKGNYQRIYTGWMNRSGDVVAAYYDCNTHQIMYDTIRHNFEIDDHDNPSLFIDEQGKLTFFYSHHARKSPICTVTSKVPEDIREWEPGKLLYLNDTIRYKNFRNSYTYACICQLSEEHNRLYLFWRGMDFKPNFSVSYDGGLSWTRGKILILPERLYSDRRPYMKTGSNGKKKIHFAFTDGHPRDEPTNSIYYMCYKNDSLFKANGESIGKLSDAPFDPAQTDMVYDARLTNEKAWIWDIAEDKDGSPVIVYARFPDDSNHCYYYAAWNGTSWDNRFMINSGGWFPRTPHGKTEPEPNYSGGIGLDHEDPSVVYLSVKRDSVFEIEKWTTCNKGLTWSTEAITCRSKNDNVRPFAIRNAAGGCPMQVIWMNAERYIHYTDYRSSLKIK